MPWMHDHSHFLKVSLLTDIASYVGKIHQGTYHVQGRSQTSSDGRAHRFYNIAIVIYWYTGSYVHLLKVVVCTKMHTTKLA